MGSLGGPTCFTRQTESSFPQLSTASGRHLVAPNDENQQIATFKLLNPIRDQITGGLWKLTKTGSQAGWW